MKTLINLNDYLTEKKAVIKKRYTENNPTNSIYTSTKIRNALFSAMADGYLTEDEIQKILFELNTNKTWLKRNTFLFNISEDQGGITTYSLSPYGQRIRSEANKLNEGLSIPHKEHGKKLVNIFVGRFQPFTLGHVKVFEQMHKKNGHPIVVFLVKGSKPDLNKNPFDADLQQLMFTAMTKQYSFLQAAIVVPNAGIDTLFAAIRPSYEPVLWGYGTDRKKSYDNMINKPEYRKELNVNSEFTGFEIQRSDDDVSASKVRNAIKIDDETLFKKMTPKSIHRFYKTLQTELNSIKENEAGTTVLNPNMNVQSMGAVELPGNPGAMNSFSSQIPGSGDIPNTKKKQKLLSFNKFLKSITLK
jgi:cytidyltransferase-like protein